MSFETAAAASARWNAVAESALALRSAPNSTGELRPVVRLANDTLMLCVQCAPHAFGCVVCRLAVKAVANRCARRQTSE